MSLKTLKILAVALAVVIVVMVGVLIFIKPAQGPALPSPSPLSVVSPDGHMAVPSLHANDIVSDPVSLSGTVTGGGWFFEGSFPVQLFAGGLMLGQAQAQAQEDWESTGTVPFTVNIPYAPTTASVGTLVFQKDNPSGATQTAESFSVPVRFK